MQSFERLEHEWAKFNDLDPAGMVACSSGTAALHLALEAFQLPTNSECIVPDFTMVACPRAVAMAGLRPVFIDCGDDLNHDDLNVDKAYFGLNVEEAMTNDVKAAVIVHVYGRKAETKSYQYINNLPKRRKEIWVVEDMSEIHGVRREPDTDAAAWSFYRNKIVAGEEGGAVWFRDPSHAKLARQLRSLGFTDAHDYRHVPRGHNYRMSNAHAEPILHSINHYEFYEDGVLDGNKPRRREIESWYDEFCPTEWRQPPRDAVWVYDFRIPSLCESVQDEIVRKLRSNKIEARHGFKPMHAQKEFEGCRRVGGENAERASREVIYLPVAPGSTTRSDAERAFELVRREVDRM